MKTKYNVTDCALFGGESLFSSPLHVGQINLPEWKRFQNGIQGIFDRRYFTNHGPKVQELENRLADFLDVNHVICMTNGTIALMVAAKALGLSGKVIVPSFTFIATVQALTWAGLDPVFCDVDPMLHTMTVATVAPLITNETSAILGVHLWGRSCPIDELVTLAKRNNLKIFFDAAHAIGCSYAGKMIGGFGDVEVFSMHATKILNSAEGGFAATNNDTLAAQMKTIRNFHTSETFVKAALRINAKMSEAQAVMGLLSLEDLPANIERNKNLYDTYVKRLSGLLDLELVLFSDTESNNYQYLIVHVNPDHSNLSRNELVALLNAENILARKYFTPGAHCSMPYSISPSPSSNSLPATTLLSDCLFQLPLGSGVSCEDVEIICSFIKFCLLNASDIKNKYQNTND